MHISLKVSTACFAMLGLSALAGDAQGQAWPAEPWNQAVNLTAIEGAGTNDFHQDLSGAFYSPVTRRLWVCRNGPSNSTSKVWSLVENGAGGWMVEARAGGSGSCEWTGFGDSEAITQIDPATNIVLIMAEAEEVIRMYDLTTPGTVVLLRTWVTTPHLPVSGGSGSEGLAFIPDGALSAGGFVGLDGLPRTSQRGMGGLVFVGHQNGGRVYVFDLSPTSSVFDFVGSFATGGADTSEVTFDPVTGHLLLLHGDNVNTTEAVRFASVPEAGGRRLPTAAIWGPPTGAPADLNLEGLAIADLAGTGGSGGLRSIFMTVDDGGATSLVRFDSVPGVCRADVNDSGTLSVQDVFDYLAMYFVAGPEADFNRSGQISVQDVFEFLAAWFTGCEP